MKKSSKLLARGSWFTRVMSVVTAVSLGSCLGISPALATTLSDTSSTSADTSSVEDIDITLPDALQSGLHTDYVSSSLTAQSGDEETTYPAAFDLRQYGGTVTYTEGDSQSTITGGWSYVTPIKLQNPFGSCWAFSITASAETSMLTALDKSDDGELNGSISYNTASAWAKLDEADDGILNGSIDYGSVPANTALIAENAIDLSERHLSYFAFSDTNTGQFESQAGEGRYMTDGSTDAATLMNCGGMPFMGVSIYSSGIGPVAESIAPYISNENTVQTYCITDGKLDYKYFTSTVSAYDAYLLCKTFADTYWTDEMIDEAVQLLTLSGSTVTAEKFKTMITPRVSDEGTWSVDDSLTYGILAELSASNIIASTKDETTGALTTDEINLMKQELIEGHPLSIAFTADQSRPGQQVTGNTYLNTTTWAQYTYETKQVNHGVTIIGYDDNYSAENFKHTIYKKDENGQLVEDEEATALTQPAGNGAWIVKNSWGSTDNDNPLYENEWGVDGSGYFYLSYYDKNISNVESYEFDMSQEAQASSGYIADQYDLSESSGVTSTSFDSVYKMANVFTNEDSEDAEDSTQSAAEETYAELVRDLACITGAPNDTVTLEVYVMSSDADVTKTIDAGNPAVSMTATYDNAGFHRMHLTSPIVVAEGQKIAVVQTTQRSTGSYERTVQYGVNKTFADAFNACYAAIGKTAMSTYTKTVVNEGESYQYAVVDGVGTWTDWSEAMTAMDAEETVENVNYVKQQSASAANTAAQFAALAESFKADQQKYQEMADAATDETEKANYQAQADSAKEDYEYYSSMSVNYTDVATKLANFTLNTSLAIDNWSIKAYSDLGVCNNVKGDVNASGAMNIVDAQIAYDLSNGMYKSDENFNSMYAMAEVNADGVVDATDARAIQYAVHYGWE